MQVDVTGSAFESVVGALVAGSGTDELGPGSLDGGVLWSVGASGVLDEPTAGPGLPGSVPVGAVVLVRVAGGGAAGVVDAGAPGAFEAPPLGIVPPGFRPVAGDPPPVGTGPQPVSLDVPVTTVAVSPGPGAGLPGRVGRDVLERPADTVPPAVPLVLPVVLPPVVLPPVVLPREVVVTAGLDAVVPTDVGVEPDVDVVPSRVRTGA